MTALTRCFALGAVTGLRSQMGMALLAGAVAEGSVRADRVFPFRLLARPGVRRALAAAAAGELIGDKLPVAPSRLTAGPLLGRLALGAAAGATLGRSAGIATLTGGALGALGAAASSFAGYHARTFLTRRTPLPDAVWATAEDAAAYRLGTAAVRT